MAEGGYYPMIREQVIGEPVFYEDPMIYEQVIENPGYDDDELEYDETNIDNPNDIPQMPEDFDPISTKVSSTGAVTYICCQQLLL